MGTLFRISIDRKSRVPLYVQIKDRITYDISVANLPSGTILPSIRALSSETGVAMATIRHAYATLVDEGFVVAHQGKGMLVAEHEHRAGATATSQALFVDLFTAAIGRAAALGASIEEIRTAGARAFRGWLGDARVLFVASEPEFVEHYAPVLSRSLADLGVEVFAINLEDVAAAAASRDILTLPLCVVTLVRSYRVVREAFGSTLVPIIGLTLNLSDDSKGSIVDIPRSARTVLLAERMSLEGISAHVEQYLTVDIPMARVALESRDLATAVGDADVIIHTLRSRNAVRRLLPHGEPRTVEIHFVPDPVSFHRMRQAIGAQREPNAKGAPNDVLAE